jgi:hypothetical protein
LASLVTPPQLNKRNLESTSIKRTQTNSKTNTPTTPPFIPGRKALISSNAIPVLL